MDVSIIVPIFNGAKWIDACFESIFNQTATDSLKVEVCVCNDSSTDNTKDLLDKWKEKFEQKHIKMAIFSNETGAPKGVGYAKNRAVEISKGEYLCFQDIDDVMLPNRILFQHNKAVLSESKNVIIGSQFKREPEGSTARYTNWANNLTEEQLNMQVFTSHGPTVIMPTWFSHRSVFDKVGGFSEKGKGTPEDLIFFNKHLDLGGKIKRVDEILLIYTYHLNAATFSIDENTIWNIRVERLQDKILSKWKSFTIWNAGKQGRKLYNCLSEENKKKVRALCDVDVHKIGRRYKPFDPKLRKEGRNIDIVHFKKAEPPFVICVKMDLTNGVFEKNLNSLHIEEGKDYVIFS